MLYTSDALKTSRFVYPYGKLTVNGVLIWEMGTREFGIIYKMICLSVFRFQAGNKMLVHRLKKGSDL